MAKWKENESLRTAMAREGRAIAKGVVKELLSIGTLGLYKPKKIDRRDNRRKGTPEVRSPLYFPGS